MTAPVIDVPYALPEQRPGDDLLVDVSVLDGLVLVSWSLLGQWVVTAVVGLGLGIAGVDTGALAGASLGAVLVVQQSLVLAGALAWLAGRGQLSWRLLGARRARPRDVVAGVIAGLVAFGVVALVLALGEAVLGPLTPPDQSLLRSEMLTGPALVTTGLLACLIGPVLEELTFRSVLFQALGRRTGWVAGVVLSSAIFGLVHVEVLLPWRVEGPVFILALAGVGAVLALAYNRTRVLLAAVVGHATFNALQLWVALTQL